MFHFLRQTGVYGIPLLLLTLAFVGLCARALLRRRARRPAAASGASTILFWGIVAALLGILGQASGMYNALSAIAQAREISPQAVAMGIAESFTTTLWGLALLVLSSLAWFLLRERPRDTQP